MNQDTLHKDLTNATESLLVLARSLSFNFISNNCLYILSEIPNGILDSVAQRKLRNSQNRRKQPVDLIQLLPELKVLYPTLHDINLIIYKANSRHTIIDIRYYSRNSLEPEYRKTVENNPPFLVSKVAMPPYHEDGQKIDINWETENFKYHWNMFKLKIKLKYLSNE
jgi:hypothetical protein